MKSKTGKIIILKTIPLGEYDKLVFIYSNEFGKLKTVAKGARKLNSKFTGHLEPLNFCNATLYFAKSKILITEISGENYFPKSRESLSQIRLILQTAEIINRMIFENQMIDSLPSLLKDLTKKIEQKDKGHLSTLAFLIKFFDQQGILPEFQNLESRYRKFFNFCRHKSLREINKIKLKEGEYKKIAQLLSDILSEETQQKWSLLTPFSD